MLFQRAPLNVDSTWQRFPKRAAQRQRSTEKGDDADVHRSPAIAWKSVLCTPVIAEIPVAATFFLNPRKFKDFEICDFSFSYAVPLMQLRND